MLKLALCLLLVFCAMYATEAIWAGPHHYGMFFISKVRRYTYDGLFYAYQIARRKIGSRKIYLLLETEKYGQRYGKKCFCFILTRFQKE